MAQVETAVEKILMDITRAIQRVTTDLEQKYAMLYPEHELPTGYSLCLDRLGHCEKRMVRWVEELEPLMAEASSTVPQAIQNINDQHQKIVSLVSFVQQLKELEEAMVLQKSAISLLDRTRRLCEIKQIQDDITDAGNAEAAIMKTPLSFIAQEIAMRQFHLHYELVDWYDKRFDLPKRSNKSRSVTITVLRDDIAEKTSFNENLTAMKFLNLLSEKIENWSHQLTKMIIPAIIASKDGKDVFTYSLEENSGKQVHTFIITTPRTPAKTMNLDAVLSTIESFFEKLAIALGDIQLLDGTTWARLIGSSIGGTFASTLLKDCIKIAASSANDEDGSIYAGLIERGRKCIDKLIELGLFTMDCRKLYNQDKEKLLVNHRCCAILAQGKQLICESLHAQVKVGDDNEVNDDQMETDHSISSTLEPLFKLPKMMISLSCQRFVQLVKNTFAQAMANKDNEEVREKLLLTARNIVSLYVLLSPRVHSAQLSSVPYIAALFYNNCHYISHQLSSGNCSGSLIDKASDQLFVEVVSKLRDTAADVLDTFLKQSKREIVTIVDHPEYFVNLPVKVDILTLTDGVVNDAQESAVEGQSQQHPLVKSLKACLKHISGLSKVLSEIQTEVVYCHTMAAVINFLLQVLLQRVLAIDDIKERDTYTLANLFDVLLRDMNNILTVGEKSRLYQYCGQETNRLTELNFCLRACMQDIEMRWSDDKGPLAEAFTPREMSKLVRALFADTKNRQQLMRKFGNY